MFSLIWQDLLYYRKQTLLNVTGLALVMFSYLILVGLAQTLDVLLANNTASQNLIIAEREFIDPGDADIQISTIEAVREYQPRQISRIAPMIFRHMRIGGKIVQLRAADPADCEAVLGMSLVAGQWPATSSEMAIGEGAARAQGWSVGTSLAMFGTEFTVTGIYRSSGTEFASVLLRYETAQELFSPRRTPQFLYLKAAPGTDLEALRQMLEADDRISPRYAVYSEESYTQRNTQMMDDLGRLMRVVSLIAILSISFGIYIATSLTLAERNRDLGILCAVGFSNQFVSSFLFGRSLLAGNIAFSAALLAACGYTTYRSAIQPMFVLGVAVDFKLTWVAVLQTWIWMVLLTTLGTWLASRPVYKVSVAKILRGFA